MSTTETHQDELADRVRSASSIPRAAAAIRRFAGRELRRIMEGELVESLPPDWAAQQLSKLTDAVLAAALDFAVEQTISRRGIPHRIDGSQPRYAIIAVGDYGGEEMGYNSPLELLLLCDQLDDANEGHVKFNAQLAASLLRLLHSIRTRGVWSELDFKQPGEWFAESHVFHVAAHAAALFERENLLSARLAWVNARVAAGESELGERFLERIRPWLYSPLRGPDEVIDAQLLTIKLQRTRAPDGMDSTTPIAKQPGGRGDVNLAIRFLQILHGNQHPSIPVTGTLAGITALNQHGWLEEQDAFTLAENVARLSRLEHHLALLLDHRDIRLPADDAVRERLAWSLGVRLPPDVGSDSSTGSTSRGDVRRFDRLLSETLATNQEIIKRLINSAAARSSVGIRWDAIEVESEMILDRERDPDSFRDVLRGHGFVDPDRAIEHLESLSRDSVAQLPTGRCRYQLALIAPRLLRELAATSSPDETLARLVAVSDSLGAKTTWWELLDSNRPMLRLLIRLCSRAAYLAEILIENPGMADELIDSLAMNRLPRAERLEMQSIHLCQSAGNLRPVLRAFRAGCQLMIGARNLMELETVTAVGEALSDTADAILRRVIQRELEHLSAQFGDPVDAAGNAVEMVALALGDFAARKLHDASVLELTFLYTGEGRTQRRVGGGRTTLSNHQFFNQLAQSVIRQLGSEPDPLYAVCTPFELIQKAPHPEALAPKRGERSQDSDGFFLEEAGEVDQMGRSREARLSQSVETLAKTLQQETTPLWMRVALSQARPCSGSRGAIQEVQAVLRQLAASLGDD